MTRCVSGRALRRSHALACDRLEGWPQAPDSSPSFETHWVAKGDPNAPQSLIQNMCLTYQARARRRERTRTLAIRTQASALEIDASKSLASRRLRPNQAKVRSTTQRRRSGLNVPKLWERVTIEIVHLPKSASAASSFGPRY